MYPVSCPKCGQDLKSKTQATHHRRRCRSAVVAKIAEVVGLPPAFEVVARDEASGARLLVKRLVGAGPGQNYVVRREVGSDLFDPHLTTHETAEEAAAAFLARREALGI